MGRPGLFVSSSILSCRPVIIGQVFLAAEAIPQRLKPHLKVGLNGRAKARPRQRRGRAPRTTSCGLLWGLVEAEDVSFGVFKCCDPAHARSDFGFREDDDASGGFDFCHSVVDGVDLDVVHEGLAGVPAGHESAVDASVSVFGFDEPVIHLPGIGDLPSEGLLVELDGAGDVVCGDFKVNDRVWHSGRRIADGRVGWQEECDEIEAELCLTMREERSQAFQ